MLTNCFRAQDNIEIKRQYRLLCCRANSLLRKFSMCNLKVKKALYTAYCSSVYCVHLWQSFHSSVLRKFKVCHNNAVRMFFGYEKFCSASAMFVVERLANFEMLYRKASWSFLCRLRSSANSIICTLTETDIHIMSPLRAAWAKALM